MHAVNSFKVVNVHLLTRVKKPDLTVITRLEVLCWVMDCLWKRPFDEREELLSPITRTTNSPAGTLFTVTKNFPSASFSRVPLILWESDDFTRATSVGVTVSPPMMVSNSVTLRSVAGKEQYREWKYKKLKKLLIGLMFTHLLGVCHSIHCSLNEHLHLAPRSWRGSQCHFGLVIQ